MKRPSIFTIILCLAFLVSVIMPLMAIAQLKTLNIKHMMRGYCHATSPKNNGLGGFAPSSNGPKSNPKFPHQVGSIQLIARPDQGTVFSKQYKGFHLYFYNTTNKELAVRAQDSRVSIIQEAQDENGVWKPIEYLPRSWCGNSYHTLHLKSNEYWQFAVPRYEGNFETKLRFRWVDQNIVSNEFTGRINIEQFHAKKPSHPTGIMDPYLD